MQQVKAEPLWDEGISSFLYGEYMKEERPLGIGDLQTFANANAVRVGDILETLYLMSIYGMWSYSDAAGRPMELDEEALNELYAKGRISGSDLDAFQGFWRPT